MATSDSQVGDGPQDRDRSDTEFAALLDAARLGDGRAFERIFRWLSPSVAAYAAASRVPDDVEIASEAFRRAFQRLDRFEGGPSGFRAWVFAIAHRLVMASVPDDGGGRSVTVTAPAPRIGPDPHPGSSPGSAPGVAGDPSDTERSPHADPAVERLITMVADLNPEQRSVVLLRLLGPLSVDEVGYVLDKPATAVAALQRRALRRVQSRVLLEMVIP
ncbi:MAG: RNA polymerase sigma factor [Acidimicrobiales bacterium]